MKKLASERMIQYGAAFVRANWWLRDVVSGAYFAHVYWNGDATCTLASHSFGVRPAFGIC